jgi:peptide/nickel transport system substrate-binding protein
VGVPRTALTLAAGLALVGAATAACSPGSSSKNKSGGTFVVARTGDIDVLDPARATAFQTTQTLGLVYDTLVDTDSKGNLVGGLAKDWKVDGTNVTLNLRTGVTFHNGDPLTAADAKATLERDQDTKTASVVRSYLLNVASIATPDDHTLQLTLKQPDASLLTALTYVGTSILDHKDIEAGTVARQPNGTGPFKWQSWQQNQRLRLAANARYFKGAPKVKSLEFRVIPDEASIVSGMKAGGFQLGILTDPAVARQARSGGKIGKLVSNPTLSYHVLQLNSKVGPLQNQQVRQAIACAINRKEIIDTVYFGQATPTGPITSPEYQSSATKGLPCTTAPDLDKAKELMAAAGYANGFKLHTIVDIGEYNSSTNIAQVLQAQLAKINVTLDLDRQQSGVYVPNWLKANFDAALALNGGSTDPYLQYNRYFTSTGSLTVAAAFADPQLNQLLQQGNATTNVDTRKDVFVQLQQKLLEDSPWVWLFRNETYYVLAKGVNGFAATPSETLDSLAAVTTG